MRYQLSLAVTCAAAALMGVGCAAELEGDGASELSDVIDEPIDADLAAASAEELTGAVYGTVSWTDGSGLVVRSGPGTSYSQVRVIAEGTRARISCQASGTSIGGNTVWNYLPDYGGYVTDYYMYTGYSSWITGVPRCGSSGGGCGDVDYAGRCDGDTLVWCEDGALRSVDCASSGRTCGWQDSNVGYNCMGSSSGGSGKLTVSQILGGTSYSVSQSYGPGWFASQHPDWYDYCQAYGDWGGTPVHCATDIAVPRGTPLYAAGNGTVITAGGTPYFVDDWNSSAGELKFRLADGTHVIYGHTSQIYVSPGQSVTKGQLIGRTGTSNGDHLHLEVRINNGTWTVDPMTYFGW